MLADFAGVLDGDFAQVVAEDLPLKQSELFAERDVRPDDRQQLGAQRRHVHRAAHRAVLQVINHLFGDHRGDAQLRLGGRSAEVRRGDDLIKAEQRIIGRRRLFLEHVERRTGDLAAAQGINQRRFINQSAARAVDEAHARLHLFNARRVDDAARLFGERRVQGDEVGARE